LAVEENELSRYFKFHALQVAREKQKEVEADLAKRGVANKAAIKAAKRGSDARMSTAIVSQKNQEKLDSLSLYVDIEKGIKDGSFGFGHDHYRIPDTDRRKLLLRYYLLQLKKKAKAKIIWQKSIGMAVDVQEGIEDRVELDTAAVAQASQPNDNIPFWYVSEALAAAMIGFIADGLARASIEPYRDHPACQDLLDNPFRRAVLEIPCRGYWTSWEAGAAERASRFRLKRQGGSDDASNFEKTEELTMTTGGIVVPANFGIEDVLQRLTPRLRKITESQTEEYRLHGAPRPPTPPALRLRKGAPWR
jgi:hypothetical protein